MNNFELHRVNPDIPLEDYMHSHHLLLGQKVENSIRIYLDTNFWIMLRDETMGRSKKHNASKLLDLLKELVSNQKIICPLSYPIYSELMLQSDVETKLATSKVIDELSSGVCFVEPEHIIKNEIGYFIYNANEKCPFDLPVHRSWTKATAVMGINIPDLKWNHPEELVVKKSYFDHMWGMSLSDFIAHNPDVEWPGFDFADLAAKTNTGNKDHSYLIKSFNQALHHEIEGVVDIRTEYIDEVLVSMAREKGILDDRNTDQYGAAQIKYRNLFSFALKNRDAARQALPSFYIPACLHASMRWDKLRNFKANDFTDFMHAEIALPYCHAFFTEKPLTTLIKSGNICLDEFYNCHVEFKIEAAIEYLRSMQLL